jgi:hypothetical protein
MSRTSPLASTTVSDSTQSRVVPYLNVAAPAALVDRCSADEGAAESRGRRIVAARAPQRVVELGQCHAG